MCLGIHDLLTNQGCQNFSAFSCSDKRYSSNCDWITANKLGNGRLTEADTCS